MKTNSRRVFLKKSLAAGAVTFAGVAMANSQTQQSNGVVSGNSKKKEVLYHKSKTWEKFYKTVY